MWKHLDLDDFPFQRIYIDLPGHGSSPLCEILPPSIQSMAEMVKNTLSDLAIGQFSIVGHSMGGYVALELKKSCLNLEKVVLLNSNPWSDSPQKVFDRKRVASLVYQAKNLFIKEAVPNLFVNPSDHSTEISELIQEACLMHPDAIAYASLAMSTRTDFSNFVTTEINDFYIVQGREDKLVSQEEMSQLFSNQQSHYFLIDGAGHMVHIEKSSELQTILKKVFEQKKTET